MWTESGEVGGGVATLFNPYLSITEMEAWHEDSWTQHWMRASISIMGISIPFVNMYAPSDKHEREAFFEMLHHQVTRHIGPLLVGGDCKCTLVPRFDRSFVLPGGRHDSLVLRRLLARDQMSDVLKDELERAEEEWTVSSFHAAAYTYLYTRPGGDFQPFIAWIGGMQVRIMPTGFVT